MATSSERTSCPGFTGWKHHRSFLKLNPDRINSMFANSTTWRSKEEEQKGRAAIHASQVNRSSASSLNLFGIGCHRSMRRVAPLISLLVTLRLFRIQRSECASIRISYC